MADYSYSPDTLAVGTIGGNGFWLMMDSWGLWGGDTPGNSNDQTRRELTDGVSLIKARPYFEEDSRIGALPTDIGATVDYDYDLAGIRYLLETSAIDLYATVPDREIVAKRVVRGETVTVGSKTIYPDHAALFHLDYVQYLNTSNFPCAVCERIQIGNAGYMDVLPGLYEIEIMADSLNEDALTCKVTVSPYDNAFNYWDFTHTYLLKSTQCTYTAMKSPYINTDGITVSYAASNWNYNIIPGLKIQLATDLKEGDKFVVAIGAEYINARSITDDTQSISPYQGCDSFFMNLADMALEPQHVLGASGDGVFYTGESRALLYSTSNNYGWASGNTRRWSVFNLSGEILDGVTFHIWPFVRLAQSHVMRPFSQWFMGCNLQTELPEDSENAYVLTMTNVGIIGGVKRGNLNCSYPIDTTVKEIDPNTYEVLGTRTDGKNLLCDGTTLYLWEAGGVYFVLSSDVVEGDRGLIHVRPGCSDLAVRNKDYCFGKSALGEGGGSSVDPNKWRNGPLNYVIGGWSAVEGPSGSFSDLAVVDKGSGKVGLTALDHGRLAGELIRIAGTTNYDGDYTVDSTSTSTEIVITATYVEETLSGATYQSLYPLDDCVPDSYHNGRMAPQGHEYVLSCPNLGSRTKWYDHYWSITWLGYHATEVAEMANNPHECALVITCDDPRYFKVVPLTWNYNPDITGEHMDLGNPTYQNCARRGLRSIQQVGEAGDAFVFKGMLNVADIDRSMVIRLNQIPANLARIYERLGVSDGSATTTTTIAMTTTTVALTTTTTEAVTTTTSV